MFYIYIYYKMSEMVEVASGTHIIASYNISFASGLGLDPRRPDVFESEGNFLMKNVEEQKEQETIDFKKYWSNALTNVISLWNDKHPCFMGFQEMNQNDEFGGTKTLIDEIQKINPNTVCEICEIAAPNNGKTSVMSVWDTTILGAKTQSASYDLGEGDGPYGIGRPICIVLTDKNILLVNLHAPNKPDFSKTGYTEIETRINNRINEFINTIENKKFVDILITGDFNDRYNGLGKIDNTGGELTLKINNEELKVKYNGVAPKSCCYNWDSACSDVRKTSVTGAKNVAAVTCSVPSDKILAGPNKDGKTRSSMGEEGNLTNYRYTGDYCFSTNPSGNLEIYNPNNRIVSSESDHEIVFMPINISLSGGKSRRKSKRKQRRSRKQRKSRKHRK
jgi:hypothetical protein